MDDDSDSGREQVTIRALSRHVAEVAERLDALRSALHLRLRSEYWFGERADAIRRSWETTVGPAMAENTRLLRAMSREMVGESVTDGSGEATDHA